MKLRRGVAAHTNNTARISPRWPAGPLLRYPGLVGSDIEVWQRFIAKHADLFYGFDYSVRVGIGGYLLYDKPENIQALEYSTKAKRIDAVGFTAVNIWAIEVKSFPGLDAIGQAISYQKLYTHNYQPDKPVMAVLVCDYADPDIRYICQSLNVIITEV